MLNVSIDKILHIIDTEMTDKTKNIKLLTYNVFLRPPPIKTNLDDFKN